MSVRVKYANAILARLPEQELSRIAPHLEPIDLPRDFEMAMPEQRIENVYFIEDGLGSIVCVSPEGIRAEVGMFGFEGFAPTPPAARVDISSHEVMMQGPGHGHRLAVPVLWTELPHCPVLNASLQKAALNLATQASFTALSNAIHSVDQRLAKWLLMAHDRISGDEINLTHEYLAILLAVRRASVTTSLHVLEGHGFIRSERKLITMRNRPAMEAFASSAYGKPEKEYRRLFGSPTL